MTDLFEQLESYGDQLEETVPPFDIGSIDAASIDAASIDGAAERRSKIWRWLLGLAIPISILLAILLANLSGGSNDPAPEPESSAQSSTAEQDPDGPEPEPDDTESDQSDVAEDSPAAQESAADGEASSGESGSCAAAGPVDLSVQANAGDSLALDTEGFTMREPTEQSIPMTIIDGGSGPCLDLTYKYTLGDTATQTLLVSVYLPDSPPNAYTRSYDLQTMDVTVADEQLAYATLHEVVVDQLILFDGAPPFYEDVLEEYGVERDSPVGDTTQWIVHKSSMVLGYQSSRGTSAVLPEARLALVPTSAVGIGAVWETAGVGGGRYELVDVTDDVATLAFSSDHDFGPTVGTLWLDLNDPLLGGAEFHTHVNVGGTIQENTITVNGPPCRTYRTITANRPLGGVTPGNTETQVLERLTCGLADSTADSGWALCQTATGKVERKTISWGDFEAHFERGEGEGVFIGWTFELREQPANDGPQIDTLEFPTGTELGAPIADIAAALEVAVEDQPFPSVRGPGIEFAATDNTGVAKIVAVPAIPSACE